MPTRAAAARRARSVLLVVLLMAATGCSSGTAGQAGSPTGRPGTGSGAAPEPRAPDEQVDDALVALDRREQVAQLFVVGVQLTDLSSGDELVDDGVGGLFLAGRSQHPADELAEVTAAWQESAPGPGLWLAADQEGGQVQSLQGPGFERLPSALEQGALPPARLATLADELGASLAGAGINVDLAPVVDVVPAGTEPANAPIGMFDRHYGATSDTVVPAARTIVDGLAAHGVTASLKHFPGLGRVQANTDTSAEVIDDVTTAADDQVRAFGTLLASPAHPFVMMSSAVYTHLDPGARAAFSPAVVTGLLREGLGFDGVVISDDLANARAVGDLPPGERATRFIAAGGTLVLTVEASVVPDMIDAVVERSESDPAFAGAVDEAVGTALRAKARAGLLGN